MKGSFIQWQEAQENAETNIKECLELATTAPTTRQRANASVCYFEWREVAKSIEGALELEGIRLAEEARQ